ncbi:Neutral zinc metallopeptidase [Phytophthora megakarya]|uniref:Neutral zinc metallopeptidase n=1 Tax=Phytophthora megakarya TaxID=4795 RepID=A0A225VW11_9STRA|nr:Neutral zinc metallopeptidase [Phytophthora megakarya]
MAPSRIPTVLFAATLIVTSSAVEFDGQNDITQSDLTQAAGTVAPGDPTVTNGSGGWSQPTMSDTPTVYPTEGETGGTEDQGSSQQTDWTSPTTPSAETPPSGFDDGTLGVDCSNSGENGGGAPGGGSPGGESSGFDDGTLAVDCNPTMPTDPTTPTDPNTPTDPTTPTTTEAPTTTSDTGDQGTAPASSSDTDTPTPSGGEDPSTPAASGGDDQSTPAASGGEDPSTPTMSTASSGTTDQGDQGSSQATASSSNTASSSDTPTQEGSDSTQQSTSTGDHATFGTVTSKSGECVVGNPNKYVSAADIDWIWENRIGPNAPKRDANWNLLDYKNMIMDHIVHNKGTLNYCVRWDSTDKLSKTVASKFQDMLARQYAAWNHWLIGYNCWPYNEIKVNIVGFAVKEASLLDWSDDSFGPITVGDLDSEGVAQCDQTCYRSNDNIGSWSDTSGCKGEPFDLSLRPQQGLVGGFGFDFGQTINLENMLETIDQEQLEILSHEIGHGFGLPDFYKPEDKPNENWPKSIMMAGSSGVVTDSDGWMLRRVLEHVKDRYNFG